ncbi:MAG: protein kinase [Gammaproteobacteria bacterium]|jgi:serine/threonine-protein kinase|nr:protein kinase [Gammaproteobacteria bacterium]
MGQVLGRYHIISELGRGGMGVVYKALDPKLERFIAIKCLSEELSADEIVVARFLREARNVAALNHPNIAQIFVADEHEGKPYFVMEYVDGESLADFIDREGQCSPEMARRVTEQAANALAAASEEGIVHRDVKPGNIMLDRRGRAVLTDFGIACIAAEQAETGGSSTVMGTPGYLPPEALTGEPVDARGDMFSLGAVYYEMLSGDRLIPARGLKETFTQFARDDFPDLSAVEGKVDDRVVAILRKLLAVKPEGRYADWPELLADMAPLKSGRTGPVERPDSGPSTAEREVTEALATARTQAATAATAATGQPGATALLETEDTRRHPVPVQGERRPGKAGRALALGFLVVALFLVAGGFGLAKMAPATWDRMTAWLPGSEAPPAGEPAGEDVPERSESGADADSVRASRAVASGSSQEALEPSAGQSDGEGEVGSAESADSGPATEPAPSQSSATAVAAADDAESDAQAADGEREVSRSATVDSEPGATDDRSLAMAEPAVDTSAAAAPSPAAPPQPAAPPPSGIVVIGVGDPVVADPMVREIESALRASGRPLVQRSFVSGYRRHVEGEEVDLAGLSGPALAAGARYVVIARALPAGERELQYYNRVETAYIAQLEAMTFDLHQMRQLGSSPVEQIEFTALNATEKAVQSVRPWLAGIRDQFD